MEASARQSFNSLHQHHCLDSAALSYLYATAVLQACPNKPTTVTSIPSSKPNLSPCSPLAKQANPLPYPTFTLSPPTASPLVYKKPLAYNQISMILQKSPSSTTGTLLPKKAKPPSSPRCPTIMYPHSVGRGKLLWNM